MEEVQPNGQEVNVQEMQKEVDDILEKCENTIAALKAAVKKVREIPTNIPKIEEATNIFGKLKKCSTIWCNSHCHFGISQRIALSSSPP